MIGDGALAFAPVSGAPNSSQGGARHVGTLADYERFLKLAQGFNVIHVVCGYPVEPIDVPVAVRHLVAGRSMLVLTDKVPRIQVHTPERARDILEMVRLTHGLGADAFAQAPRSIAVVNTNSPLRIDAAMAEGIMIMAQANQATAITPFTLAGAMAPITLAGALAQQNAEALAGIALAQAARPGAPVIYGGFTTNVNMRSGAPAFGTPEYAKAALISGQLARRYGLPFRSSNITSAPIADAQAAYEGMMATWAAIMGGASFLHQGAGWLDGGLIAGFEKFVIDVEILQMFQSFLEPIVVDDASLGLDAIERVGHGGHFFGDPHTIARYADAFYPPLLSEWRGFDTWSQDGARDTMARAGAIAEEAIAAHETPPLDAAILEELDAFIARRTREGGAPVN
jgi:trimethylamine--corrinoid protein Co-methyltransferase